MPGDPKSNSPPTATMSSVIAAGTIHENKYCDLVLRGSTLQHQRPADDMHFILLHRTNSPQSLKLVSKLMQCFKHVLMHFLSTCLAKWQASMHDCISSNVPVVQHCSHTSLDF